MSAIAQALADLDRLSLRDQLALAADFLEDGHHEMELAIIERVRGHLRRAVGIGNGIATGIDEVEQRRRH